MKPWLAHYDFMLAAGNDSADEELFRLLPETSYTIRVAGGLAASQARFRIGSPEALRRFLIKLAVVAPDTLPVGETLGTHWSATP